VRGRLVRHEHHHDVGFLCRLARGHDAQTGLLDLVPALGAGAQTDADVAAGIVQIERVGVALAAEADDRDLAGLQQFEVAVLLVEDVCHSF